MYSKNESDQDYDAVERKGISLLAQYKSRVYETCFLSGKNELGIMEEIVQSKAEKPTIVVIEDNADEWFIIRWALLQHFPEVDVVWLSRAAEVMPYMDSFRQGEKELPKLILVDLYLPSAAMGLSVLRALKSHSVYHRIPAVTLSRSHNPDDMVEAFNCSSNLYMVKPAKHGDWLGEFAMLRMYWKNTAAL